MESGPLTDRGRARRTFLKQAVTTVWASPLILTMMTRTAAAQGRVCGYTDTATATEPIHCVVTSPCGSMEGTCSPEPGNESRLKEPCHCTPP